MMNIFKIKSMLTNGASKESKLSDEHELISTIIGHLDYLFEHIIEKNDRIHEKEIQPTQESEKISNSKESRQEKGLMDKEDDENNIHNQINENHDELSSVPSIYEVSNFDDDERDSQKEELKKKKKLISKRKARMNKMSALYKNTKKPVSSFVYFYKDRLRVIREIKDKKNQAINIGNLAKIISKQWKELGEKEKRPYLAKAELSLRTYYYEKEKISKKLKALKDNLKQKKIKPTITSSDIEKDDEPLNKGPVTSFFLYFKQNCDRISKESGQHHRSKLAKIASEEWNQLPKIQKEKYQMLALRNRMNQVSSQANKQAKLQHHKKKKSKSNEEEYKPNIYRRRKCMNENDRKEEQDMEQQQIKESQNKQDAQQKDSDKLSVKDKPQPSLMPQQGQLVKQQIQMKVKPESEDKKGEKIDNFNNFTVIEVDSNDQISHIFSNMDDQVKDESFSLHEELRNERKIRKSKGPTSPFLLYYQRIVKKLMQANSNAHGSQLVRLASAKWGELPQSERIFYHNLARKSRQKYALQNNRVMAQSKSMVRPKKNEDE